MGQSQTPGPAGTEPAQDDLDDGTLARHLSACSGPTADLEIDELIDDELGEGAYQNWVSCLARVDALNQSVEIHKRVFGGAAKSIGYFTLMDDAERMRRVYEVYERSIEKIIIAYCDYDPLRILQATDALTLAIEILEGDFRAISHETIDDCMTVQMAKLIRIESQAKVVQSKIEALAKRLKEAQKAEGGSWHKMAFDFALMGLTALLPPVGMMTRVAIFVGGSIIGDAISSPEKSAGRDVAESLATDPVDILDMTQDYMNKHAKDKLELVGDAAGKAATGAGIVFNIADIAKAKETVDELRRMMADLNREHRELMVRCNGMLPTAKRYLAGREMRKAVRWQQREKLHKQREELTDLLRDLGV